MDKSTFPLLQLGRLQQIVELVRPWLLFVFYLVTAINGWWVVAVGFAIATCLAGFVQLHDSIHRSLGLSKKTYEVLITLSALLILKSGHSIQFTHLRHHGRCLKEDDVEGAPATWSLSRVLFDGPFHVFTMRFYALRMSPRTRNIQLLETAATVFLLMVAIWLFVKFGSLVGLVYWAVAAIISATIPLWASYIPHKLAPHNPMVKGAARFTRFWTPVISSFAYHHVHHEFPKVPTALLPLVARTVDLDQENFHSHKH